MRRSASRMLLRGGLGAVTRQHPAAHSHRGGTAHGAPKPRGAAAAPGLPARAAGGRTAPHERRRSASGDDAPRTRRGARAEAHCAAAAVFPSGERAPSEGAGAHCGGRARGARVVTVVVKGYGLPEVVPAQPLYDWQCRGCGFVHASSATNT